MILIHLLHVLLFSSISAPANTDPVLTSTVDVEPNELQTIDCLNDAAGPNDSTTYEVDDIDINKTPDLLQSSRTGR